MMECHLGTSKQFGTHVLILTKGGDTFVIPILKKTFYLLKGEGLAVEG